MESREASLMDWVGENGASFDEAEVQMMIAEHVRPFDVQMQVV